MNLNSVLRITARVTGVREFTKLDRAIKNTEKAAREAEKGFKQMLDSRLFRTAAVAAAGLTAAIALSTKAAIDFESSMADVRKVVDGLESPKAFAEINQEILDLSSNMPIAAKGFAEIYAAAGQAGIAREDLKQFAEQVAQVSIAFDMTAEEAGTAMAKIMTSLGLSIPEMTNLGDAMNHLSNNSASTAAQLVDFTLRAGQAGKSAGLTAEQTTAFGSAMIASGAQADVAATSFRNMIKALSRGPSMTDRQIGALDRLGFAQSDAVTNEKVYSDAVRSEGETRISIARNETNLLAKELNRRFRDQMTIIRDGLDDETEAYTEKLEDQAEKQIQGLQRRQRAEIDAARERAEASGTSAQKEIYAIQDAFDKRIDAVRDKLGDELKERRRADRDRLTAIQDSMNDRKELELAGLESNFDEIKDREKTLMEERLAAIEAQAEAGATAAAEALAKGLQEDAIGTITDVFERIRDLPKEMQLSVVSDLFGDEARALLPLINNAALLEKSLSLVGDKSAYAGSTLNEFLTRVNTTGNQVQQAQNQVENLSIVFGQTFAPALGALLTALAPVLESFTWMLQNVPGLAPVLAVLTTGFVALVAVLPALGGLVTVLGAIGGGAGAMAALGTAVGVVKAAFLAIGAVLTGPVGLAILLAGIVTAAYAFRDEIGQVLSAVGEAFSMAFQGIFDFVSGIFGQLFEAYKSMFVDPFVEAGSNLRETFQSSWQQITDFVSGAFQKLFDFYNNTFIQPVINLTQSLYQSFASIFSQAAEVVRKPFADAFEFLSDIFGTKIPELFSRSIQAITSAFSSLPQFFSNVFSSVGNAITQPISAAYEYVVGIVQNIISAVQSAISAIARMASARQSAESSSSETVETAAKGAYWSGGFEAFANGGVVTGPTLGLIGEGGEPEYIVPASKAAGFAANYMSGVRGPAAIPRFAEGGFVAPSNANVSIQTGPVTQMDGQNFVTITEMSAAVQAGVEQTLELIRLDGTIRAGLDI